MRANSSLIYMSFKKNESKSWYVQANIREKLIRILSLKWCVILKYKLSTGSIGMMRYPVFNWQYARSICFFFHFAVRPNQVEILGLNRPYSAGKPYKISCQSSGSRPPAVISWWLGGRQLIADDETVSITIIRVPLFKRKNMDFLGNNHTIHRNPE
jgi:hypothetical protein